MMCSSALFRCWPCLTMPNFSCGRPRGVCRARRRAVCARRYRTRTSAPLTLLLTCCRPYTHTNSGTYTQSSRTRTHVAAQHVEVRQFYTRMLPLPQVYLIARFHCPIRAMRHSPSRFAVMNTSLDSYAASSLHMRMLSPLRRLRMCIPPPSCTHAHIGRFVRTRPSL